MMATIGVVHRLPFDRAPSDAFADFYRAQHEPMLRLAYLLTQSRPVAEELVQDSFIRVQPHWPALDQPVAYLRRAVTNACYSYHRRRRREEAAAVAAPEQAGLPNEGEHDDVWDALATLAPRRRAVLVLRYYLDLSEAEIADNLGCRPGTVKSLSHRALADLRKALQP
jgi:RNA polymerase sigma-70 factor (sigma-E family)